MKKTFLAITLCCLPAIATAAQTPVTTIDKFNSSATTINNLREATNTKLEVIEANRQDHVANIATKADKAQVVRYWADHPDGTTLAAKTLVAYDGKIYNTKQNFLKTAGATPDAFTAYFEVASGSGGVSSYNDLTDKPTIPTALSALSDDSTHRVVTDTEKATWNGKQDILVSGANIKTVNGTSVLGAGNLVVGDGGGIAHATSDGNYYASWNGAWAELDGVFAKAADIVDLSVTAPVVYNNGNFSLALDTDLSSTSAADDTVPSAKAVAAAIDAINVTAFNPIIQADDPTGASVNGEYRATTSGDAFTVVDEGIFNISAGTFTAWDLTPAAFGFGTITNAVAGQEYCYPTPVTVSDIDRPTSISATTVTYKINGVTSTATSIGLDDTVTPCLTSSSTPGATVTGNLTIGGVAGDPGFSLTTATVVGVADNFDTNTLANYSQLNATYSVVYDAVNHRVTGTVNQHTAMYYNAQAPTGNYYVQGRINAVTPGSANGGLIVRCSGVGATSSGYQIIPGATTNLTLYKFASGVTSRTSVTGWSFTGGKTWEAGATYNVKINVIPATNTMTAYVDWDDDGVFDGTDENLGDKVDASYSGQYGGLSLYTNTAYVDDFKMGTL